MRIDCDIETDGLDATVIWCIVCRDIDTGKIYKFIPNTHYVMQKGIKPISKFKEWSKQVTEYCGNNFIAFDAYWLNKLLGCSIKVSQINDTLVTSRLTQVYRKGGHSMRNWGGVLGFPKDEFNDWSKFSWEMLDYCVNDVMVQGKIREALDKELVDFSRMSIRLEHDQHAILCKQNRDGFCFDEEAAHKLMTQCKFEADEIEEKVNELFGPRATPDREFTPRLKADGTISSVGSGGYSPEQLTLGGTFMRIKWKDFSIASTTEKVHRLSKWWRPTVKTKTGKSYAICEENLATLPDNAPEPLKLLAKWSILNSRWKSIKNWLDNVGSDGRVHGTVFSVGASTHRMSHNNPNTANIPAPKDRNGNKALYGAECRGVWRVQRKGYVLLGTDADGIQLRVLAHYINNPEYTHAACFGKKEDKTDIHNMNMRSLGKLCKSRSVAKTFIYAWLLGASATKIAQILECTIVEAQHTIDKFVKSIKGLPELLKRKTMAAKRGYMIALDGRKIAIPSNHQSLSVFLQGGEQCIMKTANVLWHKEATRRCIDFIQCGFIHDEWQTEVREDQADELGKLQVAAIVKAGEMLKMNTPMNGSYGIGKSWLDTH